MSWCLFLTGGWIRWFGDRWTEGDHQFLALTVKQFHCTKNCSHTHHIGLVLKRLTDTSIVCVWYHSNQLQLQWTDAVDNTLPMFLRHWIIYVGYSEGDNGQFFDAAYFEFAAPCHRDWLCLLFSQTLCTCTCKYLCFANRQV